MAEPTQSIFNRDNLLNVAKDFIAQPLGMGGLGVAVAAATTAAAAGAVAIPLLPAFAVTTVASVLDVCVCKFSDYVSKKLELTPFTADAFRIALRITAVVAAVFAIAAAGPEFALTVGVGLCLYALASAVKAILGLIYEKAPCRKGEGDEASRTQRQEREGSRSPERT